MIRPGDRIYNTETKVFGEVVYVDESTAAIEDAKGKVHEVNPYDCEFIDLYRQRAAELYKVKYQDVTPLQRRTAKHLMLMEAYNGTVRTNPNTKR